MVTRAIARSLVTMVLAALACTVGAAPAGAVFGPLSTWGTPGTGDAQFQAPFGLDVDAAGNVYVADCQLNRVTKFDANGTFLAKWGSGPGTANGQFDCARDVAVDATGVYVVDFWNNRVQKFTTAGAYVTQWDNAAHGTFDEPVGVATDGTSVYVVDTGPTSAPAPRLQRFSTDGTWLKLIGTAGSGAGQYATPIGVAVGASGGAAVSDQGTSRIVTFNADDSAGPAWGSLGGADGQFGGLQQGVDADAGGDVWIADYGNNRIQRFSASGTFLGKWGTTGSGLANLSGPLDVAAGPSSTLYVADTGNDRIVKYGEGATTPPTVTTGAATGVTWLVGTLNGTVNPNGTATDYQFEYGPDTSYGSAAPSIPAPAGSGTAEVAATGAMTGLMAGRTYHYRLVAKRGGVTVAVGQDRTFTTWPDPGTAAGCGRQGHTVGVVGVCADTLSYDAGRWTASGNVLLNGGVAVSGPVVINDSLKEITSSASVDVIVQRGTPVTVGSGSLVVGAAGVNDPISGRSGLATLTIQSPLTITLANVPFLPLLTNYLDAADGGGVIIAARPSLDFLTPFAGATLPTGSFAVGIHRTASGPFKVLGGGVKWDSLKIGSTWEFGVNVTYADGPPAVLSLTGKLKAPFLPSGTGAEISAAWAGWTLDQFGVKVNLPTGFPVGTTGLIADTFGGSVKGLSGGANNPIVGTFAVGGGWTKTNAPDPFNWVLHLKDVTLTINTAGSGSLSGEIDVLDGEGRLVKGTASLTLQLFPSFLASGSFNATFNAVAVSANLSLSAALNRTNFTAQGTVSGSVLGVNVGSGTGVLSDKGVGATTRLCFGWFGCYWVGAGLTWSKVTSFPPSVDWIGSDVQQYVTLTASAARARTAAASRAFTVERGRPFLLVEGRGDDARAFELVSPAGVTYRPGAKRRDLHTQTIGDVTAVVVYAPTPGTWRLRSRTEERTRFRVEAIRAIGRIRAGRITPATTKARRLPAGTKRIRVTWRRAGWLPAETRLRLYAATSSRAPGRLLKSGLRTTGTTTVKASALRKGANHLYLVPQAEGIRFDLVRFPKPVWKR